MWDLGPTAIVSSVVSGLYCGVIASGVDHFVIGLYKWANQWREPEPLSKTLGRVLKERIADAREAAKHPLTSLKNGGASLLRAGGQRLNGVLRTVGLVGPPLGPPRDLLAIEKAAGTPLGVALSAAKTKRWRKPRRARVQEEDDGGAFVVSVTEGGPADGVLSPGDKLLAVNGVAVGADVEAAVRRCQEAASLVLTVRSPIDPEKEDSDEVEDGAASKAPLAKRMGAHPMLKRQQGFKRRVTHAKLDVLKEHGHLDTVAAEFNARAFRVGLLRDLGKRRAELRFRTRRMYLLRQAVAWLIIWSACAVMLIVVIVYGALLGQAQTLAMVLGFCVGLFQSFFIVEPLQIAISSCLPEQAFNEDQFIGRNIVRIRSWLQFLGFPV